MSKEQSDRKVTPPSAPKWPGSPGPQDREKWSKWAKEHPEQAAKMIKDWIGAVEEGG
ncbi:hypothetical protein [Candidatus Magnetominusculus dajiuhuensis]|uniref:hypothetical protein n=1 Tax=Candidatus Magnetominusculus dajiuhuensis TaxID=3137712 RepID=UPI003B434A92